MVDPISDEDRSAFTRKLKAGVGVLVGVSAALVAVQVGATPLQTAGAFLLGVGAGLGLGWYVIPEGPVVENRRSRTVDTENPFADGGDRTGDDRAGGDPAGGDYTDRHRTGERDR
jgi:hypothetical protein